MAKKDKTELPKTVKITPSENTHFRVILSSEAMQPEADVKDIMEPSPVCTIVKPEPRTPATPITPLMSSDCIAASTPSEPQTTAPIPQGGAVMDVCPKTDSPSKKKGELIVILLMCFSGQCNHCLFLSFAKQLQWAVIFFKGSQEGLGWRCVFNA